MSKDYFDKWEERAKKNTEIIEQQQKKMSRKQLELELIEDWNKWQSKAHPEDKMSLIEYAEDLGVYKGYKVVVNGYGYIEFLTKE
tara:strand:+ start:187 stop:441 length:255 start_codon:yes stop_codon:yes gene_type:complete